MRIHIFKRADGSLSVMLEPSIGKGLAPVLLQDITPDNVTEKVLPEVEKMRLPRAPRQAGPPLA